MPTSAQENIASTMQSQLASQQAQWMAFANLTLESSMKLLELSWQVAKDSLDDSTQTAQQLLAAKTPQELFQIDSEKIRDNFNRMMSYAGAVSTVAADMQSELRKATQAQFGDTFGKAGGLFGNAVEMPVEGMQNPFEMMKAAMENVRVGYEQWTSTTKKAAETMTANMNFASSGASAAKKKTGAK